jgi:succinate dehydrogenase / fumarate reductase flavoprotein subunit
MWQHIGIFRNAEQLQQGIGKLKSLRKEYDENSGTPEGSKSYNLALIDALVLKVMLDLSLVAAEGALRRTESRGSHFRKDHPHRDDENWLKHTLAFYAPDGPKFEYKPVTITKWPPKERVY